MVSSELVWPAVWIPLKTVKQTSWAETWLDPEKKKEKDWTSIKEGLSNLQVIMTV